jgi:hypothetical protein
MPSWRGAADGNVGVGRFLILLLLDDDRIVPGASSETALDQRVGNSTSADTATRGAANPIPAQVTESSIQAATTMTTPGAPARHGQNDRAIAIGRKNYLFAAPTPAGAAPRPCTR